MTKTNNNRIDLILIAPGTQHIEDYYHVPLGLLYISSSLQKHNYDVHIHHILPQDIDSTVEEICMRNPLFVGLSVLSGISTYLTACMSEKIKQLKSTIPIVWGGHHPTCIPDDCLQEPYVDIVVKGEGEITACELASVLRTGEYQDLSSIPGISYKDRQGTIRHNILRDLIKDIDSLPLNFDLLDLQRYIGNGPVRRIQFFSSRGCPFNCGFCSTPQFFGRSYRYHSEEYTLGHLKALKNRWGINSIIFSDDNFYLNKKKARQIIENLYAMKINCDTIDVRLDQLEEDDLKFFNKFKLGGLLFGWESGNNRLLKLMRKNITTDDILYKAELLAQYHVPCWGSGIMLLPTEQHHETLNTINFSIQLRNILKRSIIGLVRYMPLPQTDLTALAIKEGFQKPENQKDWRKIDPLDRSYRVEWLPWINDDYDYQFKWIQEMSRTLLSVIYPSSKLKWIIHNLFSRFINKSMSRMKFSHMHHYILSVYKILARIYSRFTGKKISMLTSNITSSQR